MPARQGDAARNASGGRWGRAQGGGPPARRLGRAFPLLAGLLVAAAGQRLLEIRCHVVAVVIVEIPANGAVQALGEGDLGLPAQLLLRQAVVADPVVGAGRLAQVTLDLRLETGALQDHLRALDDRGALHRAEVDRGAVLDAFGGADRALDDVADIGPVADLFAGAPDHEGVLPQERARDHRDDGVVRGAARAVGGE